MAVFYQPLVGSRDTLPRAAHLWQEMTGNDDSPRRQPRFLATTRRQPRFPASRSSAAEISCHTPCASGRKRRVTTRWALVGRAHSPAASLFGQPSSSAAHSIQPLVGSRAFLPSEARG
jgi:hypothetical protein